MTILTLQALEEFTNQYVRRLQNSQRSLMEDIQKISSIIAAFDCALNNPQYVTADTHDEFRKKHRMLCNQRKEMDGRWNTLSQQRSIVDQMSLDCKLKHTKRMWNDMQLQLLIEKKDTELLETLKNAKCSQLNDDAWMQKQIEASHKRIYNATPNTQSVSDPSRVVL